jgi:predicted aldo/keto reductase-like oxidoreductase
MALKSMLGMGCMRLPVKGGDPTDFDYDELNTMVDTFLDAGFTYFDTSFVYHNGKSEEAVRKAIVERHDRDKFLLADKFPTFNLAPGDEDKIEGIFQTQLERTGAGYFDYYLLHNFQTRYYDGYDGKGGVIKTEHLIDHALAWRDKGAIKHLGFSFHSSPELLDRILTEHPEFEFVQIPLNWIDWGSQLVRAREDYEVIRKHGKKAVIMEPVKGGGCAQVPAPVEKLLKEKDPDHSVASWAIRFVGSLDGLVCCLSGMSTVEQVKDNVDTYRNLDPLTDDERRFLLEEAAPLYRAQGPMPDTKKYGDLKLYGVPVSAIVEAYSMCQMQPDPGFSDDNNYLVNAILEQEGLDWRNELPRVTLTTVDGEDVTDEVYKAFDWLKEHSF